MKWIDDFLNKITMYRLVLYVLVFLLIAAEIFSIFGILPYSPLMLPLSVLAILLVCAVLNFLFSRAFNAPVNVESFYITALILALIITPPASFADTGYLWFIFWAAVWAMASKYILAIGKKHIFNPAAFGVAIAYLTIGQSASWWVGTAAMMPLVLIAGFLTTRKIKRFDLVLSFMATALLSALIIHGVSAGIGGLLKESFLASPLFFFATIMLTEPLTTPPTRALRITYGVFTGLVFDPAIHLGSMYSTPELALLAGNILSYFLSPKKKLLLKLKTKEKIADNVYEFSFTSDTPGFQFRPGQYLEWTLRHNRPDQRGNRRYFTVASSPREREIKIGVKFYPDPSSFKRKLLSMKPGDTIMAGQLAGDFTLPQNKSAKLCFIAGGIGVTPFKSMIADMLGKRERRNAVMFYSNKTAEDIAYAGLLENARGMLGINTVYAVSQAPESWPGEVGNITPEMIKKNMPDWRERHYYISGPRAMVTAFQKILSEMGVSKSRIKTDFFPGFV